jgi:hypothetical protein
MFRRDALVSVGGYCKDCEPAEDVDLYLRLAAAISRASPQRLRPSTAKRCGSGYSPLTGAADCCRRPRSRCGYGDRSVTPRDRRVRRHWIEQALQAGCTWTARKHALWLVVESQGSPPALHLLRSALLSERTPAVAWLKRWRRRLFGARSVTPPATGQRT